MNSDHKIDILSVGDVVTDAFIRLLPHEATIQQPGSHHPLLCMTYGTKIPFEKAVVVNGVGNSPNAAVCFANLGLTSSLYANIGDDKVGEDILVALTMQGVSTEFVKRHKGMSSNYHYVLWYGADRTILIKHEPYDYHWPIISEHATPKWIYLSSIGEKAGHIHEDIVEYLEANESVKLAFQPGTFQIRMGTNKLRELYLKTEIFACNLEEAQLITGLNTTDVTKLIRQLHSLGPKIVVVTDGPNGSFASDGVTIYSMRNYPDPKKPYDRTGCGDAYTSTFVAALASGEDIVTALKWAPINPMSVVQKMGAQAGLLTKQKLLNLLKKAPHDYEPREIAKV
ncbi:MAG: carbohydrate kinase family protein [Candidatus Saccharibacteria bacterium]